MSIIEEAGTAAICKDTPEMHQVDRGGDA